MPDAWTIHAFLLAGLISAGFVLALLSRLDPCRVARAVEARRTLIRPSTAAATPGFSEATPLSLIPLQAPSPAVALEVNRTPGEPADRHRDPVDRLRHDFTDHG